MMHRQDKIHALPVFFGLILLALIMSILPVSGWLRSLWPSWVLLSLYYMMMRVPRRVSLGVVFVVGLLVDCLQASVLGLHTVPFLLLAYVVLRFHSQIRHLTIWQQATLLLLAGVVSLGWQHGMMSLLGQSSGSLPWPSVMTTALIWLFL